MTLSLFSHDEEAALLQQQAGTREALAPGAVLLRGFALDVAPALLQAVDGIMARACLR